MNRFISLMVFIVIVVLGWTAAWFYAANRLTDEAGTYFVGLSTHLQRFECETFDVDGFPFRFDVTCTNAKLTDSDLELSINEIKATVLVYKPTHVLVFAQGPAQVTDSFTGSKREITWDNLSLSLRTNGWALARFSLEAQNLQLFDTIVTKTLLGSVSHAEFHLVEDTQFYDADARITQISAFAKVQDAFMPEFEINDAKIILEASLAAMPDDLRLWSPAIISKNWFDSQTGLNISKLEGSDARSSFSINGNMTATAQSMPNGNFDFFTQNLAQRFEPFIDPVAIQVVFGSQSEDLNRYQSYSVVHGVVLAGNLPIFTLVPMR